MLVFAAFVWFTMKMVWPPIEQALESRKDKIAQGLAAAERGQKELELAQHRIKADIKKTKSQAAEIIENANRRSLQLVETAKENAKQEAAHQMKLAQEQIELEIIKAKKALRQQVASLAIIAAQKILQREVTQQDHEKLVDNLIAEI